MAIQALYIHIPFCHAKCAYCDFDSKALCDVALVAAADAYLTALVARIDAFGRAGALSDIETVYIGGGTPSVLGARLAELVSQVLAWSSPVEVTCEANPESLTEDLARQLAGVGVTRVSLGVQSFVDDELRGIGRLHDAEGARRAISCAKSHGFDVSCDLMCGLPGQTVDSWVHSLESALAAEPHHISVYPLIIEEGTPLAHRIALHPELEPDEDVQAACMELARDVFTQHGYGRYEVASYAKPGKACRHNIAYWTGKSYLGVGRSAASMLSAAEYRALSPLLGNEPIDADAARVRLVQTDDAGAACDFETLTEREAAAEDLMLAMRMTSGAPRGLIERARTCIGAREMDTAFSEAKRENLAIWDEGRARFVPTERGWLLGNELYGLMWDLASA